MKNDYFGVTSTILMQENANSNVIRFLVTGNSMHPFIQKNDYLSVESMPSNSYSIGDIIVVRQGEGFLTHRLVTRTGQIVITKGDACVLPDDPVSIDDILGRVISVDSGDYHFRFTSRRGKIANAMIGFLGLVNITFSRLMGKKATGTSSIASNRLISGSMRVLSYPLRLMVYSIYLCMSCRR